MKRKIIVFLSLIFTLTTLLFFAQNTLSKYRKQAVAKATADIANWDIKVNNESILNKTSLTGEIIPIFSETQHTAEGVIAPGSVGYFDVILDTSNVDVSFQYNIKAEVSSESAVTDLITTSYVIDPGVGTETTYPNTGIPGTVLKNVDSKTIRIYIKWNDENSQSMDNKKDTEAASNSSNKAKMTVTLHFSQIQS